MDKRKDNGGARKGAGRKSKAEEQELVEKLSPLDSKGFKALEAGLDDGQSWAVKLFFDYRFGKPKETKHNTHEFTQTLESIKDLYGKDKKT